MPDVSPADILAQAVDGISTSVKSVVDKVDSMSSKVDAISTKQAKLESDLAEASKPVYPYGPPNGGVHGVRSGESPNTSRPFSMMRLLMALRNPQRFADQAKQELGLSSKLAAHCQKMGWSPEGSGTLIPFSTDHMPTSETILENGETLPGYPSDLVKECGDVMNGSFGYDPDHAAWMGRKLGWNRHQTAMFTKDLSANVDNTGGTLVGLPAQGQLIDLLRPLEIFSRAGATEMTLPPQGSIRFPRDTSDMTIAAYAEGAAITESTPGTGELTLNAKKYAGLVDVPIELYKFATSVNVENWLRMKFVRRIAIQTDADMVNGTGGTGIKGVITYSAFRTVVATTVGGTGNTLEASDPSLLFADIATQNARIDRGFFFAMRPNLWSRITHRRADAVVAADKLGPYLFIFDRLSADTPNMLEGYPVILSTNIPATRTKGGVSTLTLLLAGVGPSWVIGRSGVVEIDTTNSDGSKFGQGLNTMRGIVFMDAGPENEQEFGMVDVLLETT